MYAYTGRLYITSIKENKYVCLLYEYNANAILTDPLQNRTGQEILIAYSKLHRYLTERGIQTKTHWIDNEACEYLKQFDRKTQIYYQFSPPDTHRKIGWRELSGYENHFFSGISETDKIIPMHLWEILLHQAQIKLKIIISSRRKPTITK